MAPVTIPYRTTGPTDLVPRPWLLLQVTGINGQVFPIFGLVDSGADTTALPDQYRALLGYTDADVENQESGQADGTKVTTFLASKPRKAIVPEIPNTTIDLTPNFTPGANIPLWGQKDFMTAYHVIFARWHTPPVFTLIPAAEVMAQQAPPAATPDS